MLTEQDATFSVIKASFPASQQQVQLHKTTQQTEGFWCRNAGTCDTGP